jgi:hypothetical protein
MHWGRPLSGIRAGVAIAVGKSGPELLVDFQNIGSRASSLLIASEGNMGGFGYDFSTWAVAPEGTSVQLQFRGIGPNGILKISLAAHDVQQIPPGGTYEIAEPVTAFRASNKEPGQGSIPLRMLLRQGYKVRISYRQDPDSRQTKRLLRPLSGLLGRRLGIGGCRIGRPLTGFRSCIDRATRSDIPRLVFCLATQSDQNRPPHIASSTSR